MHLKSVGYTDTVLFLTIGNAVNVQSLDIGKPDIFTEKIIFKKFKSHDPIPLKILSSYMRHLGSDSARPQSLPQS